MRNGNDIPYEKAENAKWELIQLRDELFCDNAPLKEIQQLETIIEKLEAWQRKFSK